MTSADRFLGINPETIGQAQDRLNDLCEKHGLKPWSIGSKKGNWKELCLRMCGLSPMEGKKRGRKPNDKELAFSVWYEIYGYETANDFDDLTLKEQGLPQPRKMRKKEMYDQAAKNNDICEKPCGERNKFSSPLDIVRGIHKREEKRRHKEMCEDDTFYGD